MGFNEDLEKSFKELTESARQVGYNDGLHDGWECARKLLNIFGTESLNILKECSVNDAKDRIERYERQRKSGVKIGDEIKNDGSIGYITRLSGVGSNGGYVLWSDGRSGLYSGDFILRCRTGRNYSQMADFINQIKECEGD